MEQNPDGLFLDVLGHLVEHAVAAHLVLHQGIPLTVGLEADALAQLLHIVDMVHPLSVDDPQKDDALQLSDGLRIGELGLFALVELHGLLLQLLLEAVLLRLHQALLGNRLQRNRGDEQRVQLIEVPLVHFGVIVDADVHAVLRDIRDHLVDEIPHALAIEHPEALFVDDSPLLVHDPVIFQHILADAEVIVLYLLLGVLDGIGQGLVLDFLSLRDAQGIEHANQPLGSEQPHQIVLQRDIELGFAGIPLPAGTAPQLIIDTP